MITLRLLYDYFCFLQKTYKNGLKTDVDCTVMSTSNRLMRKTSVWN